MSMTITQKQRKIAELNQFLKDQGVTELEIVQRNAEVHEFYRYAIITKSGLGNKYKMLVDDAFMTMPDNFKRFVIWHEHGHIRNKNDEVGKNILEIEIAADNYAVTKVGKKVAYNALRYIWNQCRYAFPQLCVTFPSRLKNLGELYETDLLILQGEVLKESDLKERLFKK